MPDLFDSSDPKPSRQAAPTTAEIDALLVAQLAVAWAGEDGLGEEPRLGWWRCDLVSEYGGEDLFKRLLPHTWRWATLRAVREAARRHDAALRDRSHDPDQIVSLYSLGFEIDERLDERLADLEREGRSPTEALPALAEIMRAEWDSDAFAAWLTSQGNTPTVAEPSGRRIKGEPPTSLAELAQCFLAALAAPADAYPLPHYRRVAA
jgi:hypothetical protein